MQPAIFLGSIDPKVAGFVLVPREQRKEVVNKDKANELLVYGQGARRLFVA